MKRVKGAVIVVYLIAAVSLYVCVFVLPSLAGAMKRTVALEHGGLSLSNEATAYFVRKETVYLADRAGRVAYYAGDGVKLRKDARPLDVLAADLPYTTSSGIYAGLAERLAGNAVTMGSVPAKGGLLSYFADGYESLFSPERLGYLTFEEAETATVPALNLTRHEGMFARAGEPVYKLVDDSLWQLVFWLDKGAGAVAGYADGESVSVVLPRGTVSGTVRGVADQGARWRVTLEFDKYYEGLALDRKTDATIVTEEHEGLLADNASIAERDGQSGVYVKRKGGDFAFVPVKIKKSDGTRSALWEGSFTGPDGKRVATVKAYDEILADPSQAERQP